MKLFPLVLGKRDERKFLTFSMWSIQMWAFTLTITILNHFILWQLHPLKLPELTNPYIYLLQIEAGTEAVIVHSECLWHATTRGLPQWKLFQTRSRTLARCLALCRCLAYVRKAKDLRGCRQLHFLYDGRTIWSRCWYPSLPGLLPALSPSRTASRSSISCWLNVIVLKPTWHRSWKHETVLSFTQQLS